jgi:hypothetical protein
MSINVVLYKYISIYLYTYILLGELWCCDDGGGVLWSGESGRGRREDWLLVSSE